MKRSKSDRERFCLRRPCDRHGGTNLLVQLSGQIGCSNEEKMCEDLKCRRDAPLFTKSIRDDPFKSFQRKLRMETGLVCRHDVHVSGLHYLHNQSLCDDDQCTTRHDRCTPLSRSVDHQCGYRTRDDHNRLQSLDADPNATRTRRLVGKQ